MERRGAMVSVCRGGGVLFSCAVDVFCACRDVEVVERVGVRESGAGIPVIPYWQLDWCRPTVLVLGNEAAGLHPALQACCSHGVTLPHSSQVESLNVASAAVPLLLERRRATMTASMQLSG